MKKTTLKFKTVFISDVHLGMADCKIDEINHVLRHLRCEKLVLNGDIIDGLALKRGGKWTKKHTRFIRLCLKLMEKKRTELIYIRGNHDDILNRFLPLQFDKLTVTDRHVHSTPNGDYLCIHGDGLDAICSHHKWLMHLGSLSYDFMLWINRNYNRWRRWRGKDYFSISRIIKAKVKGAVSFVGNYEEQLQHLAKKHQYRGIIAGHIHTPANRHIGEVHYLNCGDWLESGTLLVEHFDHTFEIIDYERFLHLQEEKAKTPQSQDETALAIHDEEPLLLDEDEDAEDTIIPAAFVKEYVSEWQQTKNKQPRSKNKRKKAAAH